MPIIRKIERYRMNDAWYYANILWRTALKKLSVRKMPNVIRGSLDWKRHRVHVHSRPFIVRVEVSAVCNLNCPSCSTPQKTFRRGDPRMMTLANFKTIYGKLSEYANRLTFYMEGEPMTNPHLFDMVRFASDGTVFTSFCTNFTLMKPALLEPLFDSGLDWISVCLDGFSQEAYAKYRVNGEVSKVKEGIRLVMEYKRSQKRRRPFVNVYTILFRQVLPEVDAIVRFCQETQVDQLTFRPDESNLDGTYTYKSPKLPKSRCFWPWMVINVDVDGSVYPCPVAFERHDRSPYGNLLRMNLEEVWNSDLYVETRRYLSGQLPQKPGLKLPCYNCRWYGTAGVSEANNEELYTISTLTPNGTLTTSSAQQ